MNLEIHEVRMLIEALPKTSQGQQGAVLKLTNKLRAEENKLIAAKRKNI